MTRVAGLFLLAFTALGCGYSGRDAELLGQAKKVVHQTPIFCDKHYTLDLSLGVMQGGVGSMSTEDIWVMIPQSQVDLAQSAVQKGALVRVRYDVKRFPLCFPEDRATSVEIVQ